MIDLGFSWEHAVVTNAVALLSLIYLFANSRKGIPYKSTNQRIFYFMLLTAELESILFILSYFLDMEKYFYSYFLANFSNILLFLSNVVFEFLWTLYIFSRIDDGDLKLTKRRMLAFIPLIVIFVGAIINFFTPVYFKIDADMVYTKVSLYYLNYVVAGFYLALAFVLSVVCGRAKHDKMFFPVINFMIPIITALIAEILFKDISLLMLGNAIALESLYSNMQAQNSLTDSLSGLYSRQHMIRCINAMGKKKNGLKVAGIMIDIDKFKNINDTFGHVVGDDAIRSMGNIIRDTLSKTGIGFRYAGDEFVILDFVEDNEQCKDILQKLNENMEKFNESNKKPYKLNFSVGYTVFEKDDTIDTFMARMDSYMYKIKQNKF